MGLPEHRRYKRLEIGSQNLNATLAIIDRNEVTGCLVPVKDYSKSGAGVFIKFEVKVKSQVKLSLEGVNFDALNGVVVWCASSAKDPQAPTGFSYRLGIHFTPENAAELENQVAVFDYVSTLVEP